MLVILCYKTVTVGCFEKFSGCVMMHRITIGLFFSLFYSIQGYLYLVKSTTENVGVCYTDETDRAVAFIQDLKNTSYARVVNYTSSSKPKNAHANDCNMFHGCDKWTKNNISEINSIDSPFLLPPVMDQRWNYFKTVTINTSYTTEELYNLNGSTKGFFYISILAHDSAQIVISQRENFDSGHMVVLGGFVNNLTKSGKSLIRYCPIIPINSYPLNCISYNETNHSYPLLRKGKEWILVLLGFEVNQTYIILTVHANGERILSASIYDKEPRLQQPWRIGARTNIGYSAHYKLHEYKTLKPDHRNVNMHTTVDISQDKTSICLEVTYYFYNRATDDPITIQIEKLNGNGSKKFYLEKQQDFHWIKERRETALLGPGHYMISIAIVPRAVFIGDISFCKKTAVYVTPMYESLSDCKFLDGYKPTSLDIARNDNESYLCGKLGIKNCSAVEYCDKKRCECPSGDSKGEKSQRCPNGCNKGFYNNKCNKTTCNGGAYLIHTDICIDGCTPGYRSPKCNKELLRFNVAPNVTNIRARSCVIDLSEAYNELHINYNKTELKKWNHTEIQLFKGQEWKTVSILNNYNESRVDLENLTPLTNYSVRALIVEIDEQNTTHNLGVTTFITSCVARDAKNTILNVTEDLELNIEHFGDEKSLCSWQYMNINCEPDASINISKQEITPRMKLNISSSATGFNCKLTLFATDGTAQLEQKLQKKTIPPDESPRSNVLLIAIVMLALAAIIIITLFLVRRKIRKTKIKKSALHRPTQNQTVNHELDLLPASERPALGNARLPETKSNYSMIVKISELENYMENAVRTNLFKQQHELFPRGQTQPWDVGCDPANKKKNRYGNLAAYDATRVVLTPLQAVPNSDYINANYIDGYKATKAYIATQGPKSQTVLDFWRMIAQEKVSLIVMVANVMEDGKVKCEKYWPDVQQSVSFANMTVSNTNEEVFADYVIRDLRLSDKAGHGRANQKVTQMHYTTWPDHGVPLYPQSIAEFAKKMMDFKSDAPIVVHCSAGVGRTGTIILIDACLKMAKIEGCIDALALLAQMRSQRANLVDNHLQYEFAHQVLLESLIVGPQFDISCQNFSAEFSSLLANGKVKLAKMYAKVNDLSEKEWKRNQQVRPEKCRYSAITSAASHLINLYPYGTKTSMETINAVCVDGFRRKGLFIVTEVPMSDTVEQFWRMILQQKVEQVIVLNEPHGNREALYLPHLDETLSLGDMEVTAERHYWLKNCQVYKYFISQSGAQQNMVNVVCLSGWPFEQACGPPVESLIELWEETERNRASGVSVIVCHDGATASGLFLGIGFVLEKIKLEQKVDAVLATRVLRHVRPKFISSQAQFEVLHNAAMTYLQAFDLYGNFQ